MGPLDDGLGDVCRIHQPGLSCLHRRCRLLAFAATSCAAGLSIHWVLEQAPWPFSTSAFSSASAAHGRSCRGRGQPCLPRAAARLVQQSQVCAASTDPFVQGTLRWLDELVIGEGLCPWARRARQHMRIVLVDGGPSDAVANVEAVWREFELLRKPGSPALLRSSFADGALVETGQAEPSTTLLVFTDVGYDGQAGLTTFASLWRQVGAKLSAGNGQCNIEMLAFHPWREDRGPGCSSRPLDAGHYSTRAPFPTIQLLRLSDLESARADWAERHGGPGALGLLFANKKKLRSLGSEILDSHLRRWRKTEQSPDRSSTLT